MEKRNHTKEEYTAVLNLKKKRFSIAEISRKKGITYSTTWGWLNTDMKPHCISEKWKQSSRKKIKNLGTYILRKPIYLNNLTNYEKAYFLGVYLGDGNSYDGFDMQVKDFDFADYVAELLSKMGKIGIKPKRYIRKRKERKRDEVGYRVRICRRDLKNWLEKKTNNKKNVPKFKTKKEKYWFFSGFFDSEGTIHKHNISITQKDLKLLKQIKTLLLDLDIRSKIRKDRAYHVISILKKKSNLKKMLVNINIKINRKKEKLIDSIKR